MDKLKLEHWKMQLDELWLEQMAMVHRGKNIDEAILQAYGHLISDEIRLERSTTSDFKQLVNSWLSTKRFPAKEKFNRIDISNL